LIAAILLNLLFNHLPFMLRAGKAERPEGAGVAVDTVSPRRLLTRSAGSNFGIFSTHLLSERSKRPTRLTDFSALLIGHKVNSGKH
jgi:hypothetical protein